MVCKILPLSADIMEQMCVLCVYYVYIMECMCVWYNQVFYSCISELSHFCYYKNWTVVINELGYN